VQSTGLTNCCNSISTALGLLGIVCAVHHSHTVLPVYWYPFRGLIYVNLHSFELWSRVTIPRLLWVFTGAQKPAISVFNVKFWYFGLRRIAYCIYRRFDITCCFQLQRVTFGSVQPRFVNPFRVRHIIRNPPHFTESGRTAD